MASLSNTKISDTYPLLLKIETNGVDGTLRSIEDGDGTTSALKISSGAIQVDNIKVDGNAITSTDTDGNIDLTPNGSGEVNISKVDIDSGAIDGTPIGANSASTGAFTTLTASGDVTITSATSAKPELTIKNTNADASAPELVFIKDSSSPADNDEAGRIYMFADDDAGNPAEAFLAISKLTDVSNGSEDSNFDMYTLKEGTQKATLSLSSGSVGIGTTSPNANSHLHIIQNTSGTGYYGLAVQGDDTTNGARIGIGESDSNFTTRANVIDFGFDSSTDFIYSRTGKDFIFGVNSAERMRIKSDGKVFIGSDTSRALSGVTPQMQIEGTDYSTSSMSLIGNTGTDAGTCPLLMFGRSRGTSDGTSTSVADGDRLGAIFFTGADGTDINTVGAYIETRVDGSVSGNTMPGRIQFYTNSGGSSASEKMRITSAGHVQMLEDKRISIGTWDNSGFTGSNAYGLSIDSELPIVHMSDTDTNKKAFFGLSGDNMYIGGNPVDDMIFQTGSGVERMRINSSGNVGIGETSPEHKLHIKLTGDADFNQSTDLNGESILHLEGADNDGEATMIRWANHGAMNNYFGCVQVGSSSQADFVWTAYNGSNYSEKLRVRASGHIIAKQLNQTGSTSNRYPLYWVHTGTDGSIEPYTGSVRAMKTDIADMGSVDWIHSLRPRSFKFRDFKDTNDGRVYLDTTNDNPNTEYGLIAEEVNKVEGSDYIVDKDSDGNVKGVLYHNLVPVLLKAVQELSAKVEALENA
jgi:hypothetical protein